LEKPEKSERKSIQKYKKRRRKTPTVNKTNLMKVIMKKHQKQMEIVDK
jgi:hypothetical protein